MMKTLYISDLDGTLLNSESIISDTSKEIISECIRQGAQFSVATARTPATVVPILSGIPMNLPAIVMTGAALFDTNACCFTKVDFIPSDTAAIILNILENNNISPFVYIKGSEKNNLDVFHNGMTMNRAEENFYSERRHLRLKHFHTRTNYPSDRLSNTILIFAIGNKEAILSAESQLRQQCDCSIFAYPDIFRKDIYNMEIFGQGISKANAISRMKTELGVDRLVVFGDNLNDLPMFEVADVAIAVANALPQVKNAADLVIDNNYSDAVAKFILQDFNHSSKL